MDAALVLLALVGTAVAAAVAVHRRRDDRGRDDTVRAGDSVERDARDVALSAGGRTAWMRSGGGGG